jgi:hypothetical protein
MSDTVSTTLSNIPEPSFFNSFFNMSDAGIQQCSMFQLKMVLFIILIFILTSILTSLFTMIFGSSSMYKKKKRCPMRGCPCCKQGNCEEDCECGCSNIEHFSNDSVYTYGDIVSPNYSNYQTTPLSPENTPEGNPSNLLFGQANRIITTTDNLMTLNLNIFANLYVLNGNPFGQDELKATNVAQQYLVYVGRNGKDIKLIDELTKSQDGLYKLKFKTKDQAQIKDLMSYNELIIKYKVQDKNMVLLKGKFTSV